MSEADDRRAAFIRHYLGDAQGDATIAARLAGYQGPVRAGMELLADAEVAAAITAHGAGALPIISRRQYEQFLVNLMNGEDIDVDRHGDPIPPKASDRLRASQALAALHGWNTEKSQPTTAVQINNYGGPPPAQKYTESEYAEMERILKEESHGQEAAGSVRARARRS